MNFSINVWNEYREKSYLLGGYIQSAKDRMGNIHLEREDFMGYIAHITCILKECSNYMDKCGLTMGPILWKYNHKDPTTQPSSAAFLYKDRMTEQQIEGYGKEFMAKHG